MTTMTFPPTDYCPDDIDNLLDSEEREELSPRVSEENRVAYELATRGWAIYNQCFSSESVQEIKTSFFNQLILPEIEATVYRGEEVINSSRSRASILTMTNQNLQDIFSSIYYLNEDSSLLSSITNMNYITATGALPPKPSYKIFQNFSSDNKCYVGLVNFTNTSRVTLYDNSHRYFSNLLLNIFNTKSPGASPDLNTLNLLLEQDKIRASTPVLHAGDVIIWDARLTVRTFQENNCLSKYVSFAPKKDNNSAAMSAKRTRYFYSGKTTRLIVDPIIVQSVPVVKKFSLCSSVELINEEDANKISKLFWI